LQSIEGCNIENGVSPKIFPRNFFVIKVAYIMAQLIQAVVDGIPLKDYWVSKVDGSIWSSKGKFLARRKDTVDKSTGGYIRSAFICEHRGTISLLYHRVVAETLIPFPAPEGVSKKDWNITPDSVKSIVVRQYIVNHIDHDKTNYHPSNLEWVTTKENAMKRQEHYNKRKSV
jgi:hypothetical protein